MDLSEWLAQAVEQVERWQAGWGPFERHPSLAVDPAQLDAGLTELTGRLNGNYPFFHPRYAGQMLKPPHPVAVVAYLAAMLINPNNHALDGGPPTAEMERDVVDQLAQMFRLPQHLGHLTTSGTIANLEALFVGASSIRIGAWRTAPTPTTPTSGCATSLAWPGMRWRPTGAGGWTWGPSSRCCGPRGSAPSC